MNALRLVSVVLLAASFGCSSSRAPADGAAIDGAGLHDGAGGVDAFRADAGSRDAAPAPDGGPVDAGPPRACGSSTCGIGEVCITGRCAGCCDLPPECIAMPSGCAGEPACGCFATDPCGACTTCMVAMRDTITCGNCVCMCAAPWTPIDTPSGPRPIAELRAGDLIDSIDHGSRVAVPIKRVGRRPVERHAVVRITLESGATMEISGSHPTGDGRRLDALVPGERFGDSAIASIALVAYDEPFTYDILPASDTGTYFVAGAWLGSTLFATRSACDR